MKKKQLHLVANHCKYLKSTISMIPLFLLETDHFKVIKEINDQYGISF